MSQVKAKLGWRKVVDKVFRPYAAQEGDDTRNSTTKTNYKWLRPSKSFSIFRSSPMASAENDDSSSFMSPMPEEDRRCSMKGPSFISSSELDDWEGESVDTESVNLSFINCREIIDIFPEPPAVRSSQSDSSRHSGWHRLPIPAAFLLHAACQDAYRCGNGHCQKTAPVPGRHNLKKVQGRTPTPFPNPVRYGHRRNWNMQAAISRGSASTPDLLASAMISSESLMLTEDPHESVPSLRSSSHGAILRSRSQNQLGSPNNSPYTRTSRTRLSPSMSLEDMRSIAPAQGAFFRPSLPSPSSPPSSYRTVAHVPGLERRLKHSRSTFTPAGGLSCFNDNHVSPGTPRF